VGFAKEAVAHSGILPWNLPDATGLASAAPSEGSNITLVDDDYDDVIYKPHKHTWADRLLGILCVKVPKEKKTIMHQRSVQHMPEVCRMSLILNISANKVPLQSYATSSPWILPVYVLSNRQDKDKHHIQVEAKCTIDTGNMQGNIVSRKFVQEVLEYPESAFCPLTKEEEVGATSITGHQLIPEGAVCLTWYHKKSTRVFRNMRFLISPNEHCDFIIGAQSIQKHRVLDVPNLMASAGLDTVDPTGTPEGMHLGRRQGPKSLTLIDPEEEDSNIETSKLKERIEKLTTEISKLNREAKKKNIKEKSDDIKKKETERAKLIEVYKTRPEVLATTSDKEAKELKDPPPKYLEQNIPETKSSHSTTYSGPPSANQSVKRTKG
jgi:hypothetical protein